ncbi:hypothetical protein H2198_009471 [Neophaeococcomyces mojaviensis]|uniref:Uncharacterized protein n=1 Tax=Neophaeococcomyces mojaviensis TaxID=3383035 RepID=A0ACC2ZUN2_9EURO|nr:hypothetical protein H2198_009471 [Knufia sp. JES_112]
MVQLTVGVASAFIAAGIAVLQFLLPNALALVLTGSLGGSHSAVTWSVVSRFLLSSHWPLFLRSDAAASSRVERKVSIVTWIKPLGLLLTAIAAIVTPLGLTDVLAPTSRTVHATFVYSPDVGPMGLGTPTRSDLGFSRLCIGILCPGMPDLGNVSLRNSYTNTTLSYRIKTPSIPQSLVDLYQSGLHDQPASMSSFFDVQSRQYRIIAGYSDAVHNASTLAPSYRPLSSIILDNKYELLEGVISDSVDGGIGFRNHSVPTGLQFGAEWEEDILWMTPDAVCVDTNLTTTYTQDMTGLSYSSYGSLVDQGGFANLNRTIPIPDEFYPWNDTQSSPNLYARTYQTAWSMNVYGMYYLNISEPGTNRSRISSSVGQKWKLNSTLTSTYNFRYVSRGTDLGALVDPPDSFNMSIGSYNREGITNPWNISSDNFTSMQNWCQGSLGGDKVNMSRIAVQCGYLVGAAQRNDGKAMNSVDSGNVTWERPFYVCSGATKVSIKTVRFRYNTTIDNNLKGLGIVSVKDKEYIDGDELPLWGGETPNPPMNLSYLNPLWGLIDPSMARSANLSTRRAAYFYIPASSELASLYTSLPSDIQYGRGDYVPAIRAPIQIWGSVFYPMISGGTDYSGQTNLPLSIAWQELSKNATGAAKILKLIWTDYATNALMGTRGIHTPSGVNNPQSLRKLHKRQSGGTGQFPVHELQHRLQYNWVYGIPGLISVVLVALSVFLAAIAWMCGQGTIARLQHYLISTSSGRVLAAYVYPDLKDDRHAETKQWISVVGHKPVEIEGWTSGVDAGVSWPERHPSWGNRSEKHGFHYIPVRHDVKSGEERVEEVCDCPPTTTTSPMSPTSPMIPRKAVGSGVGFGAGLASLGNH